MNTYIHSILITWSNGSSLLEAIHNPVAIKHLGVVSQRIVRVLVDVKRV